MHITVILCTYNRCESLKRALDSAAALVLPEYISWEIVVVDNNSTDHTRRVVEECCSRYPERLRYVFEPCPGKSNALNTGIREARGEIVAFVDDDVTVEPKWLQNLTAALHNGAWAGAGGRTLPDRRFLPPRWLDVNASYSLAPLAIFDLGANAHQLTEAPFGNNMAYRREMFAKYGGFRVDLGPRPDSEGRQKFRLGGGSEDSEFGRRLLAAGERLRYEPSAIVYHAVPECRVQKRYFLAWWFEKARSEIYAFGVPDDQKLRVAGIPIILFRRLIVWALRWSTAITPSRRFSCKRRVWVVAGQILESYRQSRRVNVENVSPVQEVR
jgi:glycosyltransferase involved in cell wall biosynthesis